MVDPHGQDVLAVLLSDLMVWAVASLLTVIDRVEAPPRAAGHEVEILVDVADLVAAAAVELEGPELAGVAVGDGARLRYSHGRQPPRLGWPRPREIRPSAGASYVVNSCIVSYNVLTCKDFSLK